MTVNRILVTTDFSEQSRAAYPVAVDEAKKFGAEIDLLAVVEDWIVPPDLYPQLPDPVQLEGYRQALRKSAEDRLVRDAKGAFEGVKVTPNVLVTLKPIAEEIVNYARSRGSQRIVMATHGRGGLGTLVLGSVMQKVLRHAPCPVVAVPSAKA